MRHYVFRVATGVALGAAALASSSTPAAAQSVERVRVPASRVLPNLPAGGQRDGVARVLDITAPVPSARGTNVRLSDIDGEATVPVTRLTKVGPGILAPVVEKAIEAGDFGRDVARDIATGLPPRVAEATITMTDLLISSVVERDAPVLPVPRVPVVIDTPVGTIPDPVPLFLPAVQQVREAGARLRVRLENVMLSGVLRDPLGRPNADPTMR